MITRIEAAARAMIALSAHQQTTDACELATAALAAADAIDPLRTSDDSLVEDVANVLAKADDWLSLSHPSPRHQASLRDRARAVLDLLTDAG